MLINELQERYGITRKPLYSRIKSLELELEKAVFVPSNFAFQKFPSKV